MKGFEGNVRYIVYKVSCKVKAPSLPQHHCLHGCAHERASPAPAGFFLPSAQGTKATLINSRPSTLDSPVSSAGNPVGPDNRSVYRALTVYIGPRKETLCAAGVKARPSSGALLCSRSGTLATSVAGAAEIEGCRFGNHAAALSVSECQGASCTPPTPTLAARTLLLSGAPIDTFLRVLALRRCVTGQCKVSMPI